MKETAILGLLHHENLVSLYGRTSRNCDKPMLVYEYISNGTLTKHLHESSRGILPWHTRLNIAVKNAASLVYFHPTECYSHKSVTLIEPISSLPVFSEDDN